MNKIRVLFFATLRDRAGTRSLEMEIPAEASVHDLKVRLAEDYPGLAESLRAVLVSVNREYSFDDAVIPAGAEVAVFPPVSGG